MGLWTRFANILRGKGYKLADRMERVDETLDLSYEDQLRQLQKVKRGIADVATAKKRLEIQMAAAQAEVDRLDGQARQALQAGREDLAREALSRKTVAQRNIDALRQSAAALDAQQQQLVQGEKALRAKIENFRTQKEVIKAQYSAAEAQVRIGEAATGLGDDMFDTAQAVGRIKDRVEQMQARASAIEELTAAGALEDPLAIGDDHITRELAMVSQSQTVDADLAKMRAELGLADETPALPSPVEDTAR